MTDEELKAVADGINAAAGIALAAREVARELMIDLARSQPDPTAYLAGLYDRVIRHLDPRPNLPEKDSVALARDLVGALFRDATAALTARPGSSPQGRKGRKA